MGIEQRFTCDHCGEDLTDVERAEVRFVRSPEQEAILGTQRPMSHYCLGCFEGTLATPEPMPEPEHEPIVPPPLQTLESAETS